MLMLMGVLAGAPARAAVPGTCNYTVDSHDPVHGIVRAGNDLTCVAMPRNASQLEDCVQRCCDTNGCTAYSYNHPWTVGPYFQCDKTTEFCCCLKDGVRHRHRPAPRCMPMRQCGSVAEPCCPLCLVQ